jgi:hypothetical protein
LLLRQQLNDEEELRGQLERDKQRFSTQLEAQLQIQQQLAEELSQLK